MIQLAYRDPRQARLRWLALAGLGALASIATFFPFAGTLRDPTATAAQPIAGPALFLGSLAVLALGLAGYARAKRTEERERERAADGADD